jgi:hypothetical protein
MIKTQELLKSRRFWAALGALVVAIGNDGLGLSLSQEQVDLAVMVVTAWIVGDSLRKTE